MTRDDIRAFVDRDWSRVAEAKAAAWQLGKRTAADDLRLADELRRHVRALRPAWPDDAERADDLRTHVRVNEALGAVLLRPR